MAPPWVLVVHVCVVRVCVLLVRVWFVTHLPSSFCTLVVPMANLTPYVTDAMPERFAALPLREGGSCRALPFEVCCV